MKNYPINKEEGENVEWFWVTEWWECTRLAKDIYVKWGSCPVQFRHRYNRSSVPQDTWNYCSYITFKRMMPYSYLYDTFMFRTEVAFAKAKAIGKLDILNVPLI